MSLPFHLKEIFEKEVNFLINLTLFSCLMLIISEMTTTYFFLITKNYDFGGENMIMFFFRINQLPVVYSQENEEAT